MNYLVKIKNKKLTAILFLLLSFQKNFSKNVCIYNQVNNSKLLFKQIIFQFYQVLFFLISYYFLARLLVDDFHLEKPFYLCR